LEKERQVDVSLVRTRAGHRLRANIFYRRKALAAVFRVLATQLPTPEELGIPASLLKLVLGRRAGLVLVTGRVGSGKSTLCASFLESFNSTRSLHIVTIEDPIEYVFEPKMCTFSQREIRQDVSTFQAALHASMRQSPDVIYVGELRDVDAIASTLAVAETGHLVLANLHTANAMQSIHRIVGVFPAQQRQQIAVQVAQTLSAVISQVLVPRADGNGLVAAREILIMNTAVANLVRGGQLHHIYGAMQTGGGGMQTLDKNLADLCTQGVITREVAQAHAHDADAIGQSEGHGW